MTTKRTTKKPAPDKAAGEAPSFLDWKRDHPRWTLLARRPLEFNEIEQKLIDGMVASALKGVELGRSSGAYDLLTIAEAYLRAGVAPPPPVSSWLADRLLAMADSDTPWGHKFLTRRQGQHHADAWTEEYIVAAYYDRLQRDGMKQEAAKLQTVQDIGFLIEGLTGDMVDNYYRKHFRRKK